MLYQVILYQFVLHTLPIVLYTLPRRDPYFTQYALHFTMCFILYLVVIINGKLFPLFNMLLCNKNDMSAVGAARLDVAPVRLEVWLARVVYEAKKQQA